MRRAALTLIATVGGLVLLLGYKSHGSAATLRPGAFAPAAPHAGSGSAGAGTRRPATSTPRPGASAAGAHRTVTGQTADTPYGPVQVAVVVSGRRISDVRPLQLPQGTGQDIAIDNYAVPQLIQETLSAQSAQIDMVSGATYTSQGYLESLQSALDQLHA